MKFLPRLLLVASLAAVPATLLVPSGAAIACGNSYRYELDLKTQTVVKAEELLEKGAYRAAYKHAVDATGKVGKRVEGKERSAGLDAVRARGLRVAAIATIRTEGAVAKNKAEAITWAVEQLRVLVAREKGNPYLQARLAEGLALEAGGTEEALKLLAKLADDDMMPDAAGWRLYAQLTADEKVRKGALEKCKMRATNPASCKVKDAGAS